MANAIFLPIRTAKSKQDEDNEFSDFPFPGTTGGGSLPSIAVNNTEGKIALNLVPEGLTPVAVFPPYETPRKLNAISVIWIENRVPIKMPKSTMKEKKGMYGLWTKHWRQTNSRKQRINKDVLIREIFSEPSKFRGLRNEIKNLKIDIYCYNKRLQVIEKQKIENQAGLLGRVFTQFKNILQPISNFFSPKDKLKRQTRNYSCVETDAPKFGFRTLINLVDHEPCTPNGNCTIDPETIETKSSTNDNENIINDIGQEELDFVPSENFAWSDTGFQLLKRRRRHVGKRISSSKPYCSLTLDQSDKACVNNKH